MHVSFTAATQGIGPFRAWIDREENGLVLTVYAGETRHETEDAAYQEACAELRKILGAARK